MRQSIRWRWIFCLLLVVGGGWTAGCSDDGGQHEGVLDVGSDTDSRDDVGIGDDAGGDTPADLAEDDILLFEEEDVVLGLNTMKCLRAQVIRQDGTRERIEIPRGDMEWDLPETDAVVPVADGDCRSGIGLIGLDAPFEGTARLRVQSSGHTSLPLRVEVVPYELEPPDYDQGSEYGTMPGASSRFSGTSYIEEEARSLISTNLEIPPSMLRFHSDDPAVAHLDFDPLVPTENWGLDIRVYGSSLGETSVGISFGPPESETVWPQNVTHVFEPPWEDPVRFSGRWLREVEDDRSVTGTCYRLVLAANDGGNVRYESGVEWTVNGEGLALVEDEAMPLLCPTARGSTEVTGCTDYGCATAAIDHWGAEWERLYAEPETVTVTASVNDRISFCAPVRVFGVLADSTEMEVTDHIGLSARWKDGEEVSGWWLWPDPEREGLCFFLDPDVVCFEEQSMVLHMLAGLPWSDAVAEFTVELEGLRPTNGTTCY